MIGGHRRFHSCCLWSPPRFSGLRNCGFLLRGLSKTSEMAGKYVSESTALKRNFPATSDVICCAMPRLVRMDFFYESFRTNARQSVHRAKEGQPFRAGLGSEREITWVEGCRTGHLLRRLVRP